MPMILVMPKKVQWVYLTTMVDVIPYHISRIIVSFSLEGWTPYTSQFPSVQKVLDVTE